MSASKDFQLQVENYRLTTAQILYHYPDYPSLLQTYIWQEYDIAPRFPVLHRFLNFWKREIEGPVHSVLIAHRGIISAAEVLAVGSEFRLH